MKRQGFRKHHVDVEAENEKDAVKALNQFNDDYLTEVKEYTASVYLSACARWLFSSFSLFKQIANLRRQAHKHRLTDRLSAPTRIIRRRYMQRKTGGNRVQQQFRRPGKPIFIAI
jgi:hypothetical protein